METNKWTIWIAEASAPTEVLANAFLPTVDETVAQRIKDEYRGNDVVETEDFRSYGRITLTLVK